MIKKSLTSRERVHTALNHEEPDKVPVDFGSTAANISDSFYSTMLDYYNLAHEKSPVAMGHSASFYDERIISNFNVDFRHVHILPPYELKKQLDKDQDWYYNDWGVVCRKVGGYIQRETHPLQEATKKEIENYSWPDPMAEGRTDGLRERAKKLYKETDYAIVATYVDNGPFELALQLRGFERFLIEIMIEKETARFIFHKILENYKQLVDIYLEQVGDYIDIFQFGDDLGTQNGPLISVETYREIVKPVHIELISYIKKRTKAKVWFHSCGDTYVFVPDLIDAGIDILNPIQPVNDDYPPERLKREFGEELSFHGGIDIQKVLNQDNIELLEKEIKEKITTFGKNGGYIVAPTHHLQADTKPEMVDKYFELIEKYRHYPLDSE